jgi:lia operon protein LiaI
MRSNNKGLAIVLIALGVIILLGKMGYIIGTIIGLLIPIAMLAVGVIAIKRGSKMIGWILVVLGAIGLFGKLSGVIGLLIGIAFLGFGISMLTKRRTY